MTRQDQTADAVAMAATSAVGNDLLLDASDPAGSRRQHHG